MQEVRKGIAELNSAFTSFTHFSVSKNDTL
jgi:hypothetical protein